MKLKRKSFVTVLLFVAFLMFCAASYASKRAFGSEGINETVFLSENVENLVDMKDVAFSPTYFLGEKLIVPSAYIVDGNKKYDATAVVVDPDGKAYAGRELTLDCVGRYLVEYRAEIDGVINKQTFNFDVVDYLYRVSRDCTADYSSADGGICVTLSRGKTFEYTRVIDMTDKTQSDLLFGMYSLPSVINVYDFEQIVITLTDIEDPDNKIQVAATQFDDGRQEQETFRYGYWTCYGMGSLDGLKWAGRENGTIHKDHKDNTYSYGTPITFSFCGYDGNGWGIRDYSLSFSFDYANKVAYLNNNMVCDFDDPAYFGSVWEGFANGKCYMTIEGGKYLTSKGKFVITDLNGEDLTENIARDSEAPSLTVDFGVYDENALPCGVVGQKYALYEAVSEDFVDGTVEVKRNVYFKYSNASNSVDVPVTDGAFVPEREGLYTIKYSATDRMGNATVKTVGINVLKADDCADLTMTVDSVEDLELGESVVLPVPTMTTDSRLGRTSYTIEIKAGNDIYEVALNRFRPVKPGLHEAVYTAKDRSGRTVVKSVTFNVSVGSDPVFLDDVDDDLPEFFVSGQSYLLPALVAYTYSGDNCTMQTAAISATNASGTVKIINGIYRAAATQNGETVTLTYSSGNTSVSYKRKVYVIVDDGKLTMKNIFVCDNNEVQPAANNTSIYYTTSSDASLMFANPVLSDSLNLELGFESGYTDFGSVSVYLIDRHDETVSLRFRIYGGGYLTINDGETRFPISDMSRFTLGYSSSTRTLSVDGQSSVVKMTASGSPFNGFSDNTVTMKVCFENVTGLSRVLFFSLNGHTFSDIDIDLVGPSVGYSADIPSVVPIGSTIVLPTGYAFDVVDGLIECKLTVRFPAGDAVATDGTPLSGSSADKEYTIKLDKVGKYSIRYIATDAANNTSSKVVLITVFDATSPEITVSGVPTSVNVGQKISLPSATVTDDIDGKLNSYIIVKDAAGTCVYVSDGIYTPKVAGEYTVIYFAKDSAGNINTLEFTIIVKE